MYATTIFALFISAAAGLVSAAPSSTRSGRICVQTEEDDLGYLSKQFTLSHSDHPGLYTLTTSKSTALKVKFSATESVFSLHATNNADHTHPFLSFIVGPESFNTGTLNPPSDSYVYLGGSSKTTSAGSKPAKMPNSVGSTKKAETTVWAFNEEIAHLTPTWVNADGSVGSQAVFWDFTKKFFGMTGDVQEYRHLNPDSIEVWLVLC